MLGGAERTGSSGGVPETRDRPGGQVLHLHRSPLGPHSQQGDTWLLGFNILLTYHPGSPWGEQDDNFCRHGLGSVAGVCSLWQRGGCPSALPRGTKYVKLFIFVS